VGIAGLTRSLAPEAMEAALRPAFAALRALGASPVHYKVCSTFDSSPTVGSIGCAIEVGVEVFGGRFVPLLVGAPGLGRYCVFGNLFARYGIGSTGEIHRLDRHPAMRRHPVTPADESDLRLHLAWQTNKQCGLIDVLQLERPREEIYLAVERELGQGAEIILFDALEAAHLTTVGAVMAHFATTGAPQFSVGSSGVESALGAFWQEQGKVNPAEAWPKPGAAEPLLVLSGSCSPVTAGQISWALDRGFAGVACDVRSSLKPNAVVNQAVAALEAGRSTVIYSNRGEKTDGLLPAEILGATLGQIARAVLDQVKIQRLIVAGGDTSSYAARALGVEAIEMIAPLAPGAPLCRAHAPGSPVDGLEINFKGGQVGAENYFGHAAHPELP
jgi:uncharacterized protein YgbK (DUF1537 family)